MGNEPEFEGIMFTLKKRGPQKFKSTCEKDSGSDVDYANYLIFGYYDELVIAGVNKWYQYRPMGVAHRCGYVQHDQPFADVYTIKCVFPEQDLMDDENFSFKEWENAVVKTEPASDWSDPSVSALVQSNPFICVSSIHLSEPFVKNGMNLSEMTAEVMKRVQHEADNQSWNLKELHCAVFPTIGFSDCVIVFLTDNFEKPAELISAMRVWTDNEQNAVISNCYTLCGVHKGFRVTADILQKAAVSKGEYQARVVAKFALREGVSGDAFHAALKKEILQKIEEVLRENRGDVDQFIFEQGLEQELETYYKTFGNVDTLIMPNICLEAYLCLYMDEKFNPDKQLFKRHIAGTRTDIRIVKKLSSDTEKILVSSTEKFEMSGADKNVEGQSSNAVSAIKQKIQDKWKEFIKEFERRLCEHHCALRTSRAFEQIIQRYYNIADTSHGFDIRGSMQHFLDVVFDDILLSFQCSGVATIDILRAADLFRDLVGDYVTDLLRSDKPFIEGNALAHPAIGSGTKMLFAYTMVMNEMSQLLRESGSPKNKNEIVFLVISGGADRTRAIDLFNYLIKEKYSEISVEKFCKPILIVVPEKGLYDIRGTLFRMLHECMHFCGNRERKYRYEMLIEMMAAWIAYDVSQGYFEDKFCLPQAYLEPERMYLSKAEYKDMLDETKQIIQEAREQAEQEICSTICEFPWFTEYLNAHEDESDYYEYKLFGEDVCADAVLGLKSVKECFTDVSVNNAGGCLSERIAEHLKQAESRIIAEIYAKLKEKELPHTALAFRKESSEYLDGQNKLVKAWEFAETYCKVLLGMGEISASEYEKFDGWFTYEEISQATFCSMREGLADYNAVSILKMELADYLLSFIYEEKDIDRAMPDTMDNVLRIGAVLKCAFGVSRKLKKKDRASVWDRAERMYRHAGYEYDAIGCSTADIGENCEMKVVDKGTSPVPNDAQLDKMKSELNTYMDRIDELLEMYQNAPCSLVASFLERYLKRAEKNVEDIEANEIEELREAYKSACMYRKEDTGKTLEYIFRKWEKHSGGMA